MYFIFNWTIQLNVAISYELIVIKANLTIWSRNIYNIQFTTRLTMR